MSQVLQKVAIDMQQGIIAKASFENGGNTLC